MQLVDQPVDELAVCLDEVRAAELDVSWDDLVLVADAAHFLERSFSALCVGLRAHVDLVLRTQLNTQFNLLTHRLEQARGLHHVVLAVAFDSFELSRCGEIVRVVERHVLQVRRVHAPLVSLETEHDAGWHFLDVDVVVLDEVQVELSVRLPASQLFADDGLGDFLQVMLVVTSDGGCNQRSVKVL